MRLVLALWVLLVLAAAITPAQPMGGRDLVIANSGTGMPGIYHITKDGQRYGSVWLVAPPSYPNWVEMWSDNQDFAVNFTEQVSQTASAFWRMTDTGVITTLFAAFVAGSSPNSAHLSEDGASWYVSSTGSNAVFRIPSTGGTATTLGVVVYPNAVCLDAQTGDLIVGGSTSYPALPNPPTPGTGFLLRWDAKTGASKGTIVQGILRVSGVVPDLEQGGFLVSRFDQPGVVHVSPQGQVTSILSGGVWNNAIKVEEDGTMWTIDVADITRFDRYGTVIRKFQFPVGGPALNGITIHGSRVLTGFGTAKPGARYTIQLRSQRSTEGGKPYLLAASLALGPGFRIGGRWIYLGLDPVFLVSARNLLPAVFENFAGVLDVFGNGQAALAVPASFPPSTGIRVHVQGIILDPQAPAGVSSMTNTLHFTLE